MKTWLLILLSAISVCLYVVGTYQHATPMGFFGICCTIIALFGSAYMVKAKIDV